MVQVNIHYAKTHLSELLEKVAAGEEVVIAKAGEPVAYLVRKQPPKRERVLGLDVGKCKVPADFDEPMPEIEALFYGTSL